MSYDITGRALYPLSDLITLVDFPLEEFLPTGSGPGIFDALYYTDAKMYADGGDIVLSLRLAFETEIALTPPGIEAISLVLGSGGIGWTSIPVKIVIGPDASIALPEVPLVARVSRNILQPMKRVGDRFESDDSKASIEIELGTVTVSASSEGLSIQAQTSAKLPLCMIGSSGVVVEAGTVQWLASDAQPLADTTNSLPEGFTGIFIDGANIYLPDFQADDSTTAATLRLNGYIGTGGFTGQISVDDTANPLRWDTNQSPPKYTQGVLTGKLTGFQCGLKKIEIAFVQSCLQKGSVQGEIFFPYLDKRIGVDLRLSLSGDFSLRFTGPQASNPDNGVELGSDGLLRLHKDGLLDAKLDSATFEKHAEEVAVRLSGKIRPLVAGLDWPEFDVKALTIDSHGKVKVEGGWLDLPTAKKLNFYGFTLELTKLGFGTDEKTGENWIGFNGSVNFPLPTGASVEGLRIRWDPNRIGQPDYLPTIELSGVGVEMTVPGAFSFAGKVAFVEDRDRGSKGFRGDVKLELYPLGCTIQGKLIIGRSLHGYTFFYIYLDADLPVGIPLFSTNTAIYGFQALFALNMEPNRKPDEAWYEGWYKRSSIGPTDTSKWWDVGGSLALGAGVTIGTSTDNGFSINTKTLLILVLPGPIILLEGKGNFLKQRPGTKDLTAEGAFTALLVFDGRQRLFQMNLDARYNLVKVINATASAEALFDFDRPWAWHLFLGQKEPEEKRIQAKVLDLFGASAYWMMWKNRLEFGGWYGYKGGPWIFGPLSARFEAWLGGYGLVSRNPNHLEAQIQLCGVLQLSAFGVGIDIGLNAGAEGRGPTPWEFDAWLRGALKINLLFKTIELGAEIHLHWEELVDPLPVAALTEMSTEHFKTDESWQIPFVKFEAATSITTARQEISRLISQPSEIPPDARPVLTFGRPICDDVKIDATTSADPEPDIVGKHEFRYHLRHIELLRKAGSDWRAISAAAYIQSVASNVVTLNQPLADGQAFGGGRLQVGKDEYEIASASEDTVTLVSRLALPPANTACTLIAGSLKVESDQNLKITDLKDNHDGTSTVAFSADLPGEENAFTYGTLHTGSDSFTVIGNTKRTADVLNLISYDFVPSDTQPVQAGTAASWEGVTGTTDTHSKAYTDYATLKQEVIPSLGAFKLEAPSGAPLQGQWQPTDLADPSAKTKLQLWTKTPYTYFRRNDPSIVPPPYEICDPDVQEEPICVGFEGLPLGELDWSDHHIDGIAFKRVKVSPEDPNDLGGKVSVVEADGRKALQLISNSPPDASGTACVVFSFDPLLDMIKVEVDMIKVQGGGKLEFKASFVKDQTVTIETRETISKSESIIFTPDTKHGQFVSSLSIEAHGETEGNLIGLCFLPGWKCVAIPPGAIPPNATDVEVAGMKFSGESESAAALEEISLHAAALETMLPGMMSNPLLFPFLQDLRALLTLSTSLKNLSRGILDSLPATSESLGQLHGMLQAVSVIRDRLAAAPHMPWPVIVMLDREIFAILNIEPALSLEGHLAIHFPRPITRARIALRGRINAAMSIEAYGGKTRFADTSVIAVTQATEVVLDVARLSEGWIDRVEISGLEPVVEKVCYDGAKFAWQRQQQFLHRQRWEQQLEYWYSKDEVLEPNTEYCIIAATLVSNLNQDDSRYTRCWYGFFKTGYPPLGQEESKVAYPGGGTLANLSTYVAHTIPDDGAGTGGKHPPYRGYDVGVEFSENYIDRLYNQANHPLAMRVLDNNGRKIADISNYWGEAPEQRLSAFEAAWAGTLETSNNKRCGEVDWQQAQLDVTLLAGGEHLTLQPETLHRAQLIAKDPSDANRLHIVHAFEFTTSRFVNFAHHMHSFEDKTWDVDANTLADFGQFFQNALTAMAPGAQAVRNARADLKNKADQVQAKPSTENYRAFGEALKQVGGAWEELERVTTKWFGNITVGAGLLASQPVTTSEIGVVKQGTAWQALLLESPEPLDWRRIKLALRRCAVQPVATATPALKPGSTVKISSARLPTSPSDSYWIELLARDQVDLSGYKLEVAADITGEPSFKHYSAFSKQTVLSPGSRLRAGTTPVNQREAGVEYEDPSSQPGHTPLTINAIFWIRLVNNAGQLVHQQVVFPETNYSTPPFVFDSFVHDLTQAAVMNAILLPNSDGTRTLILLKDQAGVGVPPGAYALTFEFRRDIGPEAPVLREAGRTIPELATLRFLLK